MPSKAELICVSPDRVEEFWPHVEPLLRKAIERVGLIDFDEHAAQILRGDALVWLAWSGKIDAAASTVLERAGGLVCVLVACSGEDMPEWLPLLSGIEQYARNEGCKTLRIFGRRGWLRVLDDYREVATVIEKAL